MIKKISLVNFRKYSRYTLEINKNLVIIVGNNAVGKTTILESIYAINTTNSHKTNSYKEMIQNSKPYANIVITTLNNSFELNISSLGKRVLIDKLEYKKISEFVGKLKTVMFSPEDLFLVHNKSSRRSFIDLEMSLLDKNYLFTCNNYKKLLKERNDTLRNYSPTNDLYLSVVSEQLTDLGIEIIEKRIEFVNKLNLFLQEAVKILEFEEVFEIKYLPNVSKNKLKEVFNDKLKYDILTKMTNHGPHRDDFCFLCNNKDVSINASSGQIRSIIISTKIALGEVIKNESKNNNVILLLDDVFSELDDIRQKNIVKYLLNGYQTFITTTNIHSIPKELCEHAQIVTIEE